MYPDLGLRLGFFKGGLFRLQPSVMPSRDSKGATLNHELQNILSREPGSSRVEQEPQA